MKFRKKPVVVDALQFTGSNCIECLAFMGVRDGVECAEVHTTDSPVIHTLEGDMTASPGDWIIRGVKGEYYPCKPDIFAATYDIVEEARAMKKYQSHKVVEAAPIYSVDPSSLQIVVGDGAKPTAVIDVPHDFYMRGVPSIGDYLVRYQPDGYLSWSPKAVFEAGHKELTERDPMSGAFAAEMRGTPAAVEVTVTAPAGKRAAVSLGRPGGSTSWTVTECQSQTWSVVADEALVICEGEAHGTVAYKRDNG